MPPQPDEVQAWLLKAANDLLSARILLGHDPPVLGTACFHCQQTVEKGLKAFLVWKEVPFEKVHSLTYLLDLCEGQDSGYTSLRDRAETLAPYAVEVRYPGEAGDLPCRGRGGSGHGRSGLEVCPPPLTVRVASSCGIERQR